MIREPVVLAHQQHANIEKQLIKEMKYKQPSSPGGRLASLLNSLFLQSSSKKKKSKSTTQSMKDIHEEESPGGGRRKRSSSISHFRSSPSSTTSDSKSFYSSGFRKSPPYAHTHTHKELQGFKKLLR
ncbi:hypothetical protein Dsin_003947 [Dipteronia sinensis]|uniref:Uncharacterized protein n=1 Tax=Dipteronia sinensis TaxID=43782 RepID=A0AAE0B917_9ROSI|nr:hypothetical protein Dsin_003947 [Dipteronia sinensis]